MACLPPFVRTTFAAHCASLSPLLRPRHTPQKIPNSDNLFPFEETGRSLVFRFFWIHTKQSLEADARDHHAGAHAQQPDGDGPCRPVDCRFHPCLPALGVCDACHSCTRAGACACTLPTGGQRRTGAKERIADACGVLQQMPPAIVAAAALEALGCGVRDWRACAARFPGAAFVFPSPGPSRAEDSQDELVHED